MPGTALEPSLTLSDSELLKGLIDMSDVDVFVIDDDFDPWPT